MRSQANFSWTFILEDLLQSYDNVIFELLAHSHTHQGQRKRVEKVKFRIFEKKILLRWNYCSTFFVKMQSKPVDR